MNNTNHLLTGSPELWTSTRSWIIQYQKIFILKLDEFPEKDMNQFYLTKRRKEVGAVR